MVSQLRIALFTGNYNHIPDGVSRTLNRLVGYLESCDIPVLVFAPTVDDPPMPHQGELVPVPSIPAPGRPEYRISTNLPEEARERIRKFAPTLFHIATPDILGMKALRLGKSMSVPVVGSFHTNFASYLKYYRLGLFEEVIWMLLRSFYKRCRHVYVPSPSMLELLESRGIDRGLKLWERGVDTSRFHPDRRSLEWRRERGFKDDDVVVAFVSRLVAEKNVGIYAKVLEGLSVRGLRHRGLVVGDGPARDEMVRSLPDAVFTGHLSGEELATAYASADVFLFPSDTETFGNVTLEAMASGLPVVCADAAGSRSLVDPGVNGFLASTAASHEFLDRTAELVVDAGLRGRFGAASLERSKSYEWEAVNGRLVGHYREIVSAST